MLTEEEARKILETDISITKDNIEYTFVDAIELLADVANNPDYRKQKAIEELNHIINKYKVRFIPKINLTKQQIYDMFEKVREKEGINILGREENIIVMTDEEVAKIV